MTTKPPASKTTEAALLSCLAIEPKQISIIKDTVKAQDFYFEPHRIIYRHMLKQEGEEVFDLLTLITDIDDAGDLQRCGGQDGIIATTSAKPSSVNIDRYTERILKLSRQRSLQTNLGAVVARLYDPKADPDEEALRVSSILQQSVGARPGSSGTTIQEAIKEFREWFDRMLRGDGDPYMTTGLGPLDYALEGGIYPGRAYFFAALKKMGKTKTLSAATLGLVMQNRKRLKGLHTKRKAEAEKAGDTFPMTQEEFIEAGDFAVDWYCAEMTQNQMAIRFQSVLMAWPEHQLANPQKFGLGENFEFQQKLLAAQEQLRTMDIEFHDGIPRLSDIIVNTKNRVARLGHKRLILVIDYLQLVDAGHSGDQKERMDTAEASKRLSSITKELGIVGLYVCHFNRSAENRDMPRPADLLNSGQLEKDADHLVILHRPHWQQPGNEQRLMMVWHALNRHGGMRKTNMDADLERNQFDRWTGPVAI